MTKTISKRELDEIVENVKQAKSYLKYGDTIPVSKQLALLTVGFVLGLVVAMIIITPIIVSSL